MMHDIKEESPADIEHCRLPLPLGVDCSERLPFPFHIRHGSEDLLERRPTSFEERNDLWHRSRPLRYARRVVHCSLLHEQRQIGDLGRDGRGEFHCRLRLRIRPVILVIRGNGREHPTEYLLLLAELLQEKFFVRHAPSIPHGPEDTYTVRMV